MCGLDRCRVVVLHSALVSLLAAGSAFAQGTAFPNDLAGFNLAAGNPPVVIDFDSTAAGTDISGTTIDGVTFNAIGAPLIVVDGNATSTPGALFTGGGIVDENTNKLFPTSGSNVLSPGGSVLGPGPDDAVENDDLELVFSTPVKAIGFDHLSQSADALGFTSIRVLGPGDAPLFGGMIPIVDSGGGGAPGNDDFWGFVSNNVDIVKIQIDEQDGDALFPDSNIGFDSIRIGTGQVEPTPVIPLPPAVWMFLSSAGLAHLARRRLIRLHRVA